ncbi:hypothetical protein CGA24_12390 [Salmonella enterica subsp. enterica]|nr:hypothetical protein CGA24_12390 [Salmonella enterica subsp. enterica]
MQPDLLMARLGRLKYRCNYVMRYTRYVIAPTKEHLRWFHGVSRGRFIVIFAGIIQKGLAMQKGWQAN